MEFDKGTGCRAASQLPVAHSTPKKALAEMQAGQVCGWSRPTRSVKDFAAFARQTGNELAAQNALPDRVLNESSAPQISRGGSKKATQMRGLFALGRRMTSGGGSRASWGLSFPAWR